MTFSYVPKAYIICLIF